ncbi:hypothetical protein FQR65_LT20630 [Abscondita terminalis]|nr:hypothetical protein FQR65_LT20630 [Abscondita terminalis]
MHGLVNAAHVDHLHPDSGIAIATAADGENYPHKSCWPKSRRFPLARPGFQLGLDIAAIKEANPEAIGCILGGHGITAWGATSDECERNSLWIIDTAAAYIAENGSPEPFGATVSGFTPLPEAERHARAAQLAPVIRGLASTDKPVVGHFTDNETVLDFMSREKLAPLAALGTSCPDHFLRTKVKPLVLDLPVTATAEEQIERLRELHEAYRADYRAYYEAHAQTGSATEPASPAMRGADPLIVLVPGVGMFSYGANKQTARVAGEFYINAINVMRGAEALSSYAPISDAEKFRIEYWALEEAKLQRLPKPKSHQGRIAFVTGAASGIGKAIATRLAAEGACVVVADLDLEKARAAAAELGGTDTAIGVAANVADAAAVQAAINDAVLAFGGIDLVVNNAGLSLSKPLLETTEADWNLQHDVMAKGSFLVSQAAARAMIAQGQGGDIIYISSKNSVFAGPNNIAYSATKADQAHQVRLLAVELGEHGIRVNGINPDGVVRGSGIFASGWGANRAATYGVEEKDLGQFYANRTILKREVVPENVADAVRCRRVPAMTLNQSRAVAAVDLGATSGRVMVGELTDGRVELIDVHRFPNGALPLAEVDPEAAKREPDGLAWDIDELWREIRVGLTAAFRLRPDISSIGVDSWGVDYALLREGERLGPIRAYRDPRNVPAAKQLETRIGRAELYADNGLQILPINTIFQLEAEGARERLSQADTLLMVPDYIGFLLTGQRALEWTDASTSGLLSVYAQPDDTDPWAKLTADALPVRGILPPIVQPGNRLGALLPELAAEFGVDHEVSVMAIASHDTASAVAAIPLNPQNTVYLSCGTWGLVGIETDHPVVTDAAREARFSHERGIDGTVRLLKNVTGTWLLSESLRFWQSEGREVTLDALIAEAERLPGPHPTFDPSDPRFDAPGDIPLRAVALVAESDAAAAARLADSPAHIIRAILESLAKGFAAAAREAATLGNLDLTSLHIVGGGSKGELLCQLTADHLGLPVTAGPVECTALGNVLLQLVAADPSTTASSAKKRPNSPEHRLLPKMRSLSAASVSLRRYEPRAI